MFDSSYKRGRPARLRVDRVIPGWTEALRLMQEGDTWRLFVPRQSWATARALTGELIGPNELLIFEISLLKVYP